jgi:hypothetical protein
MPGHVGTSIARNSQHMWLGAPEDMDKAALDRLRQRWAGFDPAAAQMSDDQVREVARQSGEDFRNNAPTTAEQAAHIILDGVHQGRWRILVGDDAVRLDRAVRENPEGAYDDGFFDFLSSPVD